MLREWWRWSPIYGALMKNKNRTRACHNLSRDHLCFIGALKLIGIPSLKMNQGSSLFQKGHKLKEQNRRDFITPSVGGGCLFIIWKGNWKRVFFFVVVKLRIWKKINSEKEGWYPFTYWGTCEIEGDGRKSPLDRNCLLLLPGCWGILFSCFLAAGTCPVSCSLLPGCWELSCFLFLALCYQAENLSLSVSVFL